MCSRRNLKIAFKFLFILQFAEFLALIIIGGIYVNDVDLQRAFGFGIVDHGSGLLLVGSVIPVSQYIAYRASEQHNTFLLLIHACIESTLFAIQFTISTEVMQLSAPDYSLKLRENCLQNSPKASLDCDAYFDSDRYAGFHLVWAFNYNKAMTNSDVFSEFDALQKSGGCCGFGPPLVCEEDLAAYPKDRSLDGLSKAFTAQKQFCGDQSLWYPESGKGSYTCSQVVNEQAAVQVVGGCRYEMPLGTCKDSVPVATDKGCAANLEETMSFELYIQGLVLFMFSFFQLSAVMSACCLCWKRKYTDIIPEFSEAEPVDPYKPRKQKMKKDKGRVILTEKPPCIIGSEVDKFPFVPHVDKDQLDDEPAV